MGTEYVGFATQNHLSEKNPCPLSPVPTRVSTITSSRPASSVASPADCRVLGLQHALARWLFDSIGIAWASGPPIQHRTPKTPYGVTPEENVCPCMEYTTTEYTTCMWWCCCSCSTEYLALWVAFLPFPILDTLCDRPSLLLSPPLPFSNECLSSLSLCLSVCRCATIMGW